LTSTKPPTSPVSYGANVLKQLSQLRKWDPSNPKVGGLARDLHLEIHHRADGEFERIRCLRGCCTKEPTAKTIEKMKVDQLIKLKDRV
jgi:hypothetical protein